MRRGRNRGFGGWSRSFEAWTEVLGSERLTGALLDRLTHRVHILEANGESFRLREAKTRQKRSRVTPAKTS
jgi:DNA replication protein DnaC